MAEIPSDDAVARASRGMIEDTSKYPNPADVTIGVQYGPYNYFTGTDAGGGVSAKDITLEDKQVDLE